MHTCVHGVLVHIHLSADVLHRLVCQCLHTSWHMTHSHMFQCTYVCLCIVGTHKLVSAHNPPFLSKHHTTVESLLPHTCTALPTQSRELDVAASSTLRTPNVPRTPNYAWFRSGTTKHSCIAGSQQYIFPPPNKKATKAPLPLQKSQPLISPPLLLLCRPKHTQRRRVLDWNGKNSHIQRKVDPGSVHV